MGSNQMHICTGASGSHLVDGKGLKASILRGTSEAAFKEPRGPAAVLTQDSLLVSEDCVDPWGDPY